MLAQWGGCLHFVAGTVNIDNYIHTMEIIEVCQLQRLIVVYLAEQFSQIIQKSKIYNHVCECFFLATQFKNII